MRNSHRQGFLLMTAITQIVALAGQQDRTIRGVRVMAGNTFSFPER
jgi:hypothetical protein